MEEGERRCKRDRVLGEIGAGEVGSEGITISTMEISSSNFGSKRRKIDCSELLQLSASSSVHSVNLPEDSLSPPTSWTSNGVPPSLCSSNESVKDSLRSSDLKSEGCETEISTFTGEGFSRETTPSSEVCGDSVEMESSSPTKKPSPASSRRKPSLSTGKMPSAEEIEEFFSAAERCEQKRFADKYNYDTVKDVPVEGRYQWVRLKP